MVEVYVKLIESGAKDYTEFMASTTIPDSIKEEVTARLEEDGWL